MLRSRELSVTGYLRRGFTRAEAIRSAGMSRTGFYHGMRLSPEFRKAVMLAESEAARTYGFRRSRRQPSVIAVEATSGTPRVYALVAAILPLLVGLLLLALGAPAGQVQLSW